MSLFFPLFKPMVFKTCFEKPSVSGVPRAHFSYNKTGKYRVAQKLLDTSGNMLI